MQPFTRRHRQYQPASKGSVDRSQQPRELAPENTLAGRQSKALIVTMSAYVNYGRQGPLVGEKCLRQVVCKQRNAERLKVHRQRIRAGYSSQPQDLAENVSL